MRANLSADSRGQDMGERSGTKVEPNNKLEGCSMKDQLSVPERRHPDNQNDHSSFSLKRYLNDAIDPFNAFALRQNSSAAPMNAYTRAWDVQFEEATRRYEVAERRVWSQ